MNKSKIIVFLRQRYPEKLGIRRRLQKLKVKRILRHKLPDEVINACEKDPQKKNDLVVPFANKWQKYLKPTYDEINYILKNAPKYVSGAYDLDELRLDMLFCKLAYGFIPSEYAAFHFENKDADLRKEYYSDSDTYIFGYSVNNIVATQIILNKGSSAEHFRPYLKRDICIIDSTHKDYDDFLTFTNNNRVFVKKKIYSSMGKGVELVNINNINSLESYYNDLSSSGEWLLEQLVTQRPEMAAFNESSVNTIRCMTFRLTNGVVIPYCILRTGRSGSFVDNAGSGGVLAGVNVKTGIVETDGFDEFGSNYTNHPDSQVAFKDYTIPDWDNLINLCIKLAEREDSFGYLAWDMAFTENGWVVIEVNEVGQFLLPQMVYQKGLKNEFNEYFKKMIKVI